MLPSPAAAATAAAAGATAAKASTARHAAAESGRTLLVILRPVFGGDVLADDDYIAFFQALDHFRGSAVGNAERDYAMLRLVVGAEHPDDAPLPFLRGRGRWRSAIARSIGAGESASTRPITTLAATARIARAGEAASTCAGTPLSVRPSLLAVRLIASVSPCATFPAASAIRTTVASTSPASPLSARNLSLLAV
jgi:hypothetical protein